MIWRGLLHVKIYGDPYSKTYNHLYSEFYDVGVWPRNDILWHADLDLNREFTLEHTAANSKPRTGG